MAVNTTKGGGIYITIGGDTRPLYDALQDARRRASWAADDISKSFKGALGEKDAGSIMSGVTRSFAQLRAAAQGMGADLSAYRQHFQNLGRDIGLVADRDLRRFSMSMEAAFKRRNQNDITAALKNIQRQTGMSIAEVNKLASSFGVAGLESKKAAAESYNFGSRLSDSMRGSAERVSSLARQILVLAGAYKTLQGATAYFRNIFDFSANLESSRTAIASVVAATNNITNAEGRALQGAEKFAAAQQISAQLMEQIQLEALKTPAAFNDIVDGVSGIIAPATKAGISLQKLPKFAVMATQAMLAMKVPVQQMRTEIESLLSGNISKTQDILATNLGITGEMVKKWQQQGTLVEEIEKRLQSFALAGDAIADSWDGLRNNMRDAFDFLSGQTGKGLFEGAKQSYRELLDLLLTTDAGKIGISSDVENLVAMVQELQEEIGQHLLGATREFIETIRELNKAENVAALKKELEDVGKTLSDIWDFTKAIGDILGSVISSAINGWNQMPQIVKELGLLGAICFGGKGLVVLAGVGQLIDSISTSIEGLKAATSGDISWGDWIFSNHNQLKDALNRSKNEKEAAWNNYLKSIPPIARPQVLDTSPASSFVGPPKPSGGYNTSSAIGGFSGAKGSSKGQGSIDNARERIQKLREEIAALNGEASKQSNSLEQKLREIERTGAAAKMSAAEIAQLKTEYREAFQASTLRDFGKEMAKLTNDTAALRAIEVADTVRDWEQRFKAAGLSAEESAANIAKLKDALGKQQQYKDLQTAARFFEEIAALSGNYGMALQAQNQLIEYQAELYRTQLPEALKPYIEQWERLQKLEKARDPFSGMVRGLQKYGEEATNLAKGMENAVTTAFSGMEDAFVQFVTTGKLSFTDLANSIIADLARIAIRASITGPLAQGLGNLIGGLFGGSWATSSATSSAIDSAIAWVHAKGGAYSGGTISDYANSIISTPTYFNLGTRINAFARGAGVMGEAGAEAIMPLRRGANGRLGVEMYRDDAGEQSGGAVTVNIINSTGEQVSQQTRTDNYGNKTIDVMIGDAAAKQAAKPGSAMNRAIRGITGVQQPVIRR